MIAGFTGAGISTESGVPDFRSPGSPWMQATSRSRSRLSCASAEARREAWRRKFTMDDLYRGARPEPRPSRPRRPVDAGKMPAVITQNIDGLHQEAGRRRRTRSSSCTATAPTRPASPAAAPRARLGAAAASRRRAMPPDCRRCGGILKSATISFGQAMPDEPMRRAQELTLACDLFLVDRLVARRLSGGGISGARQGKRRARSSSSTGSRHDLDRCGRSRHPCARSATMLRASYRMNFEHAADRRIRTRHALMSRFGLPRIQRRCYPLVKRSCVS